MKTIIESKFHIKAGDFCFTFLQSGDIYEAKHKGTMINQLLSNPIDGALNNLFLRIHLPNGIQVAPLIGVKSDSKVRFSDSQVIWEGTTNNVHYLVTFTLTEQGIWFWDVIVDGNNVEVDVLYGQDLGLADKGAVRTNEAFLSQYIDHAVFEDTDYGYVVCSRQNQAQHDAFPYLQQGSLTKATGYSTDGFQFFGLSYKETNQPEALSKASLANEIYQYEFAYTALQSERVKLKDTARFVFYGLFQANHPEAITSLDYRTDLLKAWDQVKEEDKKSFQSLEQVKISSIFGEPLQTTTMTKAEVEQHFPHRHQEEWDGKELLSFFTDTHEHVVLKEKELLLERPHGHILMSGSTIDMNEKILTSTSFMYGVFNSQLLIGNTSFHKMMTNTRNALNISKTSGQRIYIEIDGIYHLLTMPSMFEIGFNYARWFYKTKDDLIIITNYTTADLPEVHLHVRSTAGKAYRYLVTNQISMNNNEYEVPFHMEIEGQQLSFHADSSSDSASIRPQLCYRLLVEGAELSVEDERMFAENLHSQSASLTLLQLSASSEWSIAIQGSLNGDESTFTQKDAMVEIERYRQFYRELMNGFNLSLNQEKTEELEKINALSWWYTHNMLVHYLVPHGLEQYGGAAWGTRDVCQGPTEYFMATQKYDSVKEILKTVYSHQYEDDGNWPQWFMFDEYFKIQQEESHGDIIVWPLKVLSDYLAFTHDYSILEEKVPYTNREGFNFTEETATLFDHAKKEIEYMKQHFLHDTYLSSYGDGDWDDTLQPANPQLKQFMVSSWTVALTYQVLKQFAQVLTDIDPTEATELKTLVAGIEKDFNHYMLQAEVIPGFVYMPQADEVEFMLHPTDTKTGIQYRLLPMTRSMISELLTPEQAESHFQLIKEKLSFPDGVRLMDQPANYTGGVSTHFKRAEQAANFGREVGLQYVHAHIRFVEAMAKLGKVEEAWSGLQTINPIGIQDVVPNAARRQSNAYFSSSDGQFNNRYEAQERFNELREGNVPVKGGWRIYSSGPGIYMNQLISNCLGIRREGGDLVIDPVLPPTLDGLEFNFNLLNRPVKFIYHFNNEMNEQIKVNGHAVKVKPLTNRYRKAGVRLDQKELESKLEENNLIEIFM